MKTGRDQTSAVVRRVLDQFQVVLGVDDLALGEREVAADRELRLVDHRRQAAVRGHVAEEVLQARDEVPAALLERRLHRRRVGQERVGRGERVDDEVGGEPGAQLVARRGVEARRPRRRRRSTRRDRTASGRDSPDCEVQTGSRNRLSPFSGSIATLPRQAAQHLLAGGQRLRPSLPAAVPAPPRPGRSSTARDRPRSPRVIWACFLSFPAIRRPGRGSRPRSPACPRPRPVPPPRGEAAAGRRPCPRPRRARKPQATSAPAGTGARKRTLSRP